MLLAAAAVLIMPTQVSAQNDGNAGLDEYRPSLPEPGDGDSDGGGNPAASPAPPGGAGGGGGTGGGPGAGGTDDGTGPFGQIAHLRRLRLLDEARLSGSADLRAAALRDLKGRNPLVEPREASPGSSTLSSSPSSGTSGSGPSGLLLLLLAMFTLTGLAGLFAHRRRRANVAFRD